MVSDAIITYYPTDDERWNPQWLDVTWRVYLKSQVEKMDSDGNVELPLIIILVLALDILQELREYIQEQPDTYFR